MAGMSDDVVWEIEGTGGAIDGTYRGKDEVTGFFGKLFEATNGTFKSTPEFFVADDDHLVAYCRMTAERAGKSLDSGQVGIYDVRDGLTTRARFAYPDARAVSEFWS